MTADDLRDAIPRDWRDRLSSEFSKEYWPQLNRYVEDQRSRHSVYPSRDAVFETFRLSRFAKTRVVIVGQDPYPQQGLAHGLCFSVPASQTKIPLSLRNIRAVLNAEGFPTPDHGDLSAWADQGVLMLNTTLTVRHGSAGSHRASGWQHFTTAVIRLLGHRPEPTVFILWGRAAQTKKQLIVQPGHLVLTAPHPAARGRHRHVFLSSTPFSETNAHLAEPIDWGAIAR